MYKKTAAIAVAAVIGMAVWSILDDGSTGTGNTAFHITLASPDLYEDGIYSEKIVLDGGKYSFRFVPNGDSPRTLGISLQGGALDFSEDFKLVGTLHRTGISEYYTWDYSGQNTINVSEKTSVLVKIDPHGNMMGPVSVDIMKE